MKIITIEQAQKVYGGVLAAVAALVAIFVLPKLINENRKEYNQWGRDLSAQA